jgi:hypothetical protein
VSALFSVSIIQRQHNSVSALFSVVDRRRVDADLDHSFHFEVVPEPDPDQTNF